MLPIFYSEMFLQHQAGMGHPESPQRLTAVVNALRTAPWAEQLDWRSPTPLRQRDVIPWLETAHDPAYVKLVEAMSHEGGGRLDADTGVSVASYDVARLAVNAWLDGVTVVLDTGRPAFVLARPPGHHAVRQVGMGFCLFANAAIAAHYALTQPGVNRVAIMDWDVHHGNGTQAIVETNPQIAYCSTHQFPCYPGTGAATERGWHQNVLNIPMPPGSAIADYEQVWQDQVIPFLTHWQPDLLIISAGYDANAADPLASVCLEPQDFGQFSQSCLELTPKVLFGLEGGYHLEALAQSVMTTLEPCLSIADQA